MTLAIKQKPCSQKGYKVFRKHVTKKVDGYKMATKWLQFEGIEKPSPHADWVFIVEARLLGPKSSG
jgi:hypothetical protein